MDIPKLASELVVAYREHYPVRGGNWWWTTNGICYICQKKLWNGEIIYRDNSLSEMKYNCCVGCTLPNTTLSTIVQVETQLTTGKCNCEWEVVYTQGCQCGGK